MPPPSKTPSARCAASARPSPPTWMPSLGIPTATSVRTVPAKLMIDNRIVINNHLRRARGGKVSFTHLIGWAIVQTLKVFPSQNVSYAELDGKPSVVVPAHVNLGIAIDLPKPDGTRSLLVPEHQARRHHDLRRIPRGVRRRGRPRARQQADGRRLRRHHDLAHQPGRDRHRALGSPAHAGRRVHRRRGRSRVPGRVPGLVRAHPRRPRHRQDHHADQHLRPPRHPGRRVRRVPEAHP